MHIKKNKGVKEMTFIKIELRKKIFELTLFDFPEKDRALIHILFGFSTEKKFKLFSIDLFFIRLFRD